MTMHNLVWELIPPLQDVHAGGTVDWTHNAESASSASPALPLPFPWAHPGTASRHQPHANLATTDDRMSVAAAWKESSKPNVI